MHARGPPLVRLRCSASSAAWAGAPPSASAAACPAAVSSARLTVALRSAYSRCSVPCAPDQAVVCGFLAMLKLPWHQPCCAGFVCSWAVSVREGMSACMRRQGCRDCYSRVVKLADQLRGELLNPLIHQAAQRGLIRRQRRHGRPSGQCGLPHLLQESSAAIALRAQTAPRWPAVPQTFDEGGRNRC